MSIVKNEEYPFPFWEEPSSSTIDNYINQVKNFFIEKFGFYVSDITTYQNKRVCYFSINENVLPSFCFIHGCPDTDGSSNNYYKYFYIAPVLYNESTNDLLPQTNGEYKKNLNNSNGAIFIDTKAILLYCSNPTKRIGVSYIELSDGRKMIFFKNKDKDTGLDDLNLIAMNGCLYYTKVKDDNDSTKNIESWIILAKSPASSYILDIHNTLTYNNGEYLHEYPYQYINPRYFSSAGGFIPSLTMKKDFLLKLPYFYLGDQYYLKNIYYFSKVLNFDTSGPVGSIVSIKDKNYIILQYSNKKKNISDNTNVWDADMLAINTVSLITPIEIEET